MASNEILAWADLSEGTQVTPTAAEIIAHITHNWDDRSRVVQRQVRNEQALRSSCRQTMESGCYAAIAFNPIRESSSDATPVNYTIFHKYTYDNFVTRLEHPTPKEKYRYPIQWAINKVSFMVRFLAPLRSVLIFLPHRLSSN